MRKQYLVRDLMKMKRGMSDMSDDFVRGFGTAVVAVDSMKGWLPEDAVSVVRCKNCVHWVQDFYNEGECEWLEQRTKDNWFCADGAEE